MTSIVPTDHTIQDLLRRHEQMRIADLDGA
jgi:hypothetical protein